MGDAVVLRHHAVPAAVDARRWDRRRHGGRYEIMDRNRRYSPRATVGAGQDRRGPDARALARRAAGAANHDPAADDPALHRRSPVRARRPAARSRQRDRLRRNSVLHAVLGRHQALRARVPDVASHRTRVGLQHPRLDRVDRHPHGAAVVVAALSVGRRAGDGDQPWHGHRGAADVEPPRTLPATSSARVSEP